MQIILRLVKVAGEDRSLVQIGIDWHYANIQTNSLLIQKSLDTVMIARRR